MELLGTPFVHEFERCPTLATAMGRQVSLPVHTEKIVRVVFRPVLEDGVWEIEALCPNSVGERIATASSYEDDNSVRAMSQKDDREKLEQKLAQTRRLAAMASDRATKERLSVLDDMTLTVDKPNQQIIATTVLAKNQ